MNEVTIYTDGASQGNPGPGGYGVVMMAGSKRLELSQGFRKTTNNRMELLGVIAALEALKKRDLNIAIYSDSKYVVDSVSKGWVFRWKKKGFKDKKNADLWRRFLELYPQQKIKFHWVKGHADNAMNERCDVLAVEAAHTQPLLIDAGYELSAVSGQ
jgi:ribonuclease HI